MKLPSLLCTIAHAGQPALSVISLLPVFVFAAAGLWIFRNRHRLFDRDPEVAEYQDSPGVRHIRLELVLVIWGTLMLLAVATCVRIWSER